MKNILFIILFCLSGCDDPAIFNGKEPSLGENSFIINNDSGPFSNARFIDEIGASEFSNEYSDGDYRSGYFLGLSLMYGFDVDIDQTEGVKVFESVWEGGVVDAGYNLYEAYYFGKGVTRDMGKALYYLSSSAENGYVKSQRRIAFAYKGMTPTGLVETDIEKSLRWFVEAASGGDKISAANVAQIYYDGDGIPRDEKKVFQWMSRIERLPYGNEMEGFSGLAKVYEEGIGTDIDLVQAYKYYDLLSPGSAPDKARLEEQMTPEQIQEAIRLSRQWQEEHNTFVPSYYGLEYQEDGTFQ